MEFIKELIVNLIGSSFILALFLFISKKYFEKWISAEFDKRTKISSSKIDQAFKVSNSILEKETGIYPEILEVVYRLRNAMRDGIEKSDIYEWSKLKSLCAHLTENLFKYRLFISEEIFTALHRLKQITQEALIFYDIRTRKESFSIDKEEYYRKLNEFETKYKEVDELYSLISKLIRQKIDSIIKI